MRSDLRAVASFDSAQWLDAAWLRADGREQLGEPCQLVDESRLQFLDDSRLVADRESDTSVSRSER